MSNNDYEAGRPDREIEYREAYGAWIASLSPQERARMAAMGLERPCLDHQGTGGPELDVERLAAKEDESGDWEDEADDGEGGNGGRGGGSGGSGESATGVCGDVSLAGIEREAADLLSQAMGELIDAPNLNLTFLALAYAAFDTPEVRHEHTEADWAAEAGVSEEEFREEWWRLAAKLGLMRVEAHGRSFDAIHPDHATQGEAIELVSPQARAGLRAILADIFALRNRRITVDCLALVLKVCYEGESQTSVAERSGVKRATVSKRCVAITDRLGLEAPSGMRDKRARANYRNARIRSHNRTDAEKARAAFERRKERMQLAERKKALDASV